MGSLVSRVKKFSIRFDWHINSYILSAVVSYDMGLDMSWWQAATERGLRRLNVGSPDVRSWRKPLIQPWGMVGNGLRDVLYSFPKRGWESQTNMNTSSIACSIDHPAKKELLQSLSATHLSIPSFYANLGVSEVPFILENPQIRDISNACSDVKRTSNVMGLFPEIGALQATEGSHRCCHWGGLGSFRIGTGHILRLRQLEDVGRFLFQ